MLIILWCVCLQTLIPACACSFPNLWCVFVVMIGQLERIAECSEAELWRLTETMGSSIIRKVVTFLDSHFCCKHCVILCSSGPSPGLDPGGGAGAGATLNQKSPLTQKIDLKMELNSLCLKGKGRKISLFLHQC